MSFPIFQGLTNLQKEEYKEIKELLKPEPEKIQNIEKTDAEISLEFLEEYRKLTRKYKRDFNQVPPQIVKLDFIETPPQIETK